MGLIVVFAAGYVFGTRADAESLDEVVDALRTLRRSEEFHEVVKAARVHVAESLRGLAGMIERGATDTQDVDSPIDLLERVRLLSRRR